MFEAILGGVLALAVLVAWVRLWGRATRGWRWWGLMALQPLAAGLLWLALFPPLLRIQASELLVAGRGAPMGTYDVGLPEAGTAARGASLPDMATALRRRGAASVRLVGEGVEARDVAALDGVKLAFDAPPLPRGLVRLGVNGPVTVGGTAVVYGVAGGLAGGNEGGRALLFDPGGRQASSAAIAADGSFLLRGRVRAAGAADWQVRLQDGAGAAVERAVVPVVAAKASAVRLWVRAGAPGAELKYVQRWALDAGLDFASDVTLGGGVRVGEGRRGGEGLAMNAEALARVDVLVLDERSWAGLSAGERGAVLAAVRQGMGLVLRVTGPVSAAVRRQWAAMGAALRLADGDAVREVRLAGGGTVQALRLAGSGGMRGGMSGGVPWLRDRASSPVAVWQPLGRGRVTVWPVQDAFTLVLAGDAAAFAGVWSEMVAAVARPVGGRATVPGWGFVGERVDVCGLTADAFMVSPVGRATMLVPDPASDGCAGFWPVAAGWHQLRVGEAAVQWLRVLPDDALPGVRAAARRDAAIMLAGAGGDGGSGAGAGAGSGIASDVRAVRGPAWPWWLGFVAVAGGLWWLERRRLIIEV